MKYFWVVVVVSAFSVVGAIFNEPANLAPINCTTPFQIVSRNPDNLAMYIRCRFYIPRQETCPRYQVLSLRAKRCVFPSKGVKLCDRMTRCMDDQLCGGLYIMEPGTDNPVNKNMSINLRNWDARTYAKINPDLHGLPFRIFGAPVFH